MTPTISIECPSCALGGEVAAGAAGKRATCSRCGTKFSIQPLAPEPESVERLQRDCPACAGERLEDAEGELGVSVCRSCRGGFLPAPGAEILVGEGLRLTPRAPVGWGTAEPIACPECSGRLTPMTLEGVSVEGCPTCGGTWIDRGELHRLSGGRWGEPLPELGLYERLSEPSRLAIDRLSEYREYHLKQDADTRANTAFLGRDLDTWYDLRGPLGTVATVVGSREGLLGEIVRDLGRNQERTLWLLDKYSTGELLQFERSKSSMEVTAPTIGLKVGRVESSATAILREYRLRDAAGEVFARIRRPILSPSTFSVRSPSGSERLGAIRRRWSGWGKEHFSDGDDFAIDFGEHGWTLEERCTLLAAAIAIDLDAGEARRRAVRRAVS